MLGSIDIIGILQRKYGHGHGIQSSVAEEAGLRMRRLLSYIAKHDEAFFLGLKR